MTAVNCWFLSDVESEKMWEIYARDAEGVAIRSTVRALSQYVFCDPRLSYIGRVEYVDLKTHTMTPYDANQAHRRAFLKELCFAHENEVRITTFPFKGPMCVGMDGLVLKPHQYEGANANNFENPGLYIRASLTHLIHGIAVAPGADQWFELLVRRLVQLANITCPVVRSALEK